MFSFRRSPKSKNDLKLIRFIIKQFGYRPKKLLLFKIALTHKSISNSSDKLISNERLEFLGDTIIDAIVADFLYHKFPEEDEGHLTKVKSKMVSRKTLTSIAQSMQISDHIVYQTGRSIRLATLEGNAFEALIGAIYLDSGYDAAKKSINHSVLRTHLDLPTLLEKEIDFKSRLYIWAQKNRLEIEFKLFNEKFADGKWNYGIEVFINSNPYGRGSGDSKKSAEQAASRETLQLMGMI
ncbi:ribonuclease III [Brumimicrobium mesophilum]|uniref:ribonuclease III n=1 Tax=Brumimicrobium mesophilum TaxID=392717 RepID=UPI0021D1DC78|nr:ribonuclease III [Brumimicrobium mesophilum]